MPDIANGIKSCGVDVAISSNGVLFTKEKAMDCLAALTWIRFSVASMEETSYDNIQRGRKGDLELLKTNLMEAVRVKRDQNLKTTLGVQCILLPDNKNHILNMAKELREIGVDYFTVKPYSQHLHSNNTFSIDYEEMFDLEKELCTYTTEDFSIYFRANAMKKIHHEKSYRECLGLPFMTHIDAKGNVWPCVAHIGINELCYGNINEQTFGDIWEGERRQKVIDKLNSCDINRVCREACRMDEINKYLNELKYPGKHVNFI